MFKLVWKRDVDGLWGHWAACPTGPLVASAAGIQLVCNWMDTLTKAHEHGEGTDKVDKIQLIRNCEIGEVCEDAGSVLQTVATGAWPEAAIAVKVGVILKLDWRFASWIAGKVSVQCFDPKNGARALPARQRLTGQEAARVKCRAV